MNIPSMRRSITFILLGLTAASAQAGNPIDLRSEHLADPIRIDAAHPRLSWKLKPDDPAARNIVQTAYRILVADSPEQLDQDRGNLWDSGKIDSDQSVLIPYQGTPLKSRQTCYWKVRTWDRSGQPGPWSGTARWQMALLQPGDWAAAEWIGLGNHADHRDPAFTSRPDVRVKKQKAGGANAYPSPLLRQEIPIHKTVKSATAYVSGVGYCELYINGEKVGDHVLDPGQTSYDKHTLYVTHDITRHLQAGKNALGLWLGNGFFGQNIAFGSGLGYGPPRVRALFVVDYADGSSETFSTTTRWKATVGPVVFDNVYGGETYDARRAMPDWCNPGFDDSRWPAAARLEAPCPDDKLRSQLLPPIRVMERISPVEIMPVDDGKYLIDFGKNIAGWVHITVDQAPGSIIRIKTGEALSADKRAVNTESTGHFATGLIQELVYICKGGGESWEPRFTYHGFRYAEISGLRTAPAPGTIEAVLVHSDLPRTGSFSCSDPLLNTFYETSLLTLKDNWHSFPEDCPHREKCGWLGDAHATADASLYSYDMNRFFTKYLLDIEDNLTANKQVREAAPGIQGIPPSVAPGKRVASPGSIDWGVAMVLVPWRLYLHTGDRDVFQHHYPHMKEFIRYFLTCRNEAGIIENGLGDWCPPRWDRQEAPQYMECHPHVSGTAFFYETLQIVAEMANILGDAQYGTWCLEKAQEIKTAFNAVYLRPIAGTNLKHYGSQTATVMALKFGMVPDAEKESVVKALAYDINRLHGGHHACGIHGLRHLYTVLTETGQDELAYKMLTDPTFPGPAYIVNCGMTTWPERQWEWDKLPEWERSLNHPMQGGFTAFMHEALAGIQPSSEGAGYKHFTLAPRLTGQLDWVKASVESPHGTIRSEWKNSGGHFEWVVEIPPNTTAELLFPTAPGTPVLEDGKPRTSSTVGSGTYHFTAGK